jgi:hypothetical protein
MPEINIRVVNRHHGHHANGVTKIYIGRGSPLGNPFTHMKGTKAEFIVASREEAVKRYRQWLPESIRAGNIDAVLLCKQIADQALKPEGVDLVCFCAPKACHGDVIKELLTEGLTQILKEKERGTPDH